MVQHNAQEFVNSNFPIDFKIIQSSKIENIIFLELDLYCSKHYISIVEATVDIL
jgi:hypothetical protein